MQQESRVKKSLLNARVNLIFYFLTLILSFFSRKIFLDTLGAEFMGLTGTLQNLLGFLNLAELGVGSAIAFVLYKPLFDRDEAKINEIISVLGYLYRCIGFVILGAGIILACFLPLIFPHTPFELGVIFFAYIAFLTSSLIGYFANYKQSLLSADQKNYVVTAYFQSAGIIKTLIQLTCAYYTANYYLWVFIELFFGIIHSFILNWKINQVYPWLKGEVRQGKKLLAKYPQITVKVKQLFVHRITAFIQCQTTPFLVYSFVSLQIVAYYANYTLVTEKLKLLFNGFLDGTGAGVGSLIAEGNRQKILSVYWELFSIRYFVASFCVFSFYHLLPPFITLWIGPQYILTDMVLMLVLLGFFINMTRGVTDQFIYGYGLFHDVWAPIAEAVIFIVTAIAGGFLWGLEGILLGGIISQLLIIQIWKPCFLFSRGFVLSIWSYWRGALWQIFLATLSFCMVSHMVHQLFNIDYAFAGWEHWLLYATVIATSFALFHLMLMYACSTGMRCFVNRFLHWRKH